MKCLQFRPSKGHIHFLGVMKNLSALTWEVPGCDCETNCQANLRDPAVKHASLRNRLCCTVEDFCKLAVTHLAPSLYTPAADKRNSLSVLGPVCHASDARFQLVIRVGNSQLTAVEAECLRLVLDRLIVAVVAGSARATSH